MDKYEYAKRLKAMVNREINLEQRSKQLAKASFQYNEKLEKVEMQYFDQEEQFYHIKQRIEKGREMIAKHEQLLEEGHAVLAEIKQSMEDAERNRHESNQQLEIIHNLKRATNTYINLKALPHRIQGVATFETEDKEIWRPFCADALSNSPEELKQIIWGNSENAQLKSEAWEQFVFRLLREMFKQNTEGS